ncbi:hypothetical protein QRQ56_27065 [Bradyrhizobium sp. U531]|uniref:hypothetical protein n=1 Tax=Bradyrhizobium sp. U531 TaxID=3053458 RepID=UPI003F42AF8E
MKYEIRGRPGIPGIFNLPKGRDEAEADQRTFSWQPSGTTQFRALQPGELFLFKVDVPNSFIVSSGIFGHTSIEPLSLAWEAFGLSRSIAKDSFRAGALRSPEPPPGLELRAGLRSIDTIGL